MACRAREALACPSGPRPPWPAVGHAIGSSGPRRRSSTFDMSGSSPPDDNLIPHKGTNIHEVDHAAWAYAHSAACVWRAGGGIGARRSGHVGRASARPSPQVALTREVGR